MLHTLEKKIIFSNKYIELQNNIVKDSRTQSSFEHIKIIENNSTTPGAVVMCQFKSKFLLIQSYRYGLEQMCWEFPRGYTKHNESPLECATRELKEETSVDFDAYSDSIEEIGRIAINSSYIASEVPIYLIQLNEDKPESVKLQENEFISSFKWICLDELYKKLKNGIITDGFTTAAIMHYQLKEI